MGALAGGGRGRLALKPVVPVGCGANLMEDLYFRIYGDYPVSGPVFYRRDECPWLAEVERQWQVIRDEFVDFHYHRGNRLNASFIPDDVPPQRWRSVNFVTYQHWYRDNCAAFPKTTAILRRLPYLTTASINLLEPHSKLEPHNGDTNTTYRCHLGLIVPAPVDRCGLEVGGQRRGWEEGHAFAFNEAPWHYVWNDTDKDRVILVFDILRPEYRPRMLHICGAVLGAMTLTLLETRVKLLRRLPTLGRRLLHRLLGVSASLYLRLFDKAR